MSYAIYLRKSRADLEAEANGELETLARHERHLKDLASKLKLPITKEYKEVVSGETISARPQMQELLQDVQNGLFEGVLVMEIERLARGDTIDQGLVAQAFKFSNTKIITPTKTYDPNNEFDEEYFEFGLFMSRREYKTIKRRLQAGRERSAREGKFIGSNTTPYGYNKEKIKGDKGFKLVINENEAQYVRLMFQWLIDGNSKREIKRKLDAMGIPSRSGKPWDQSVIKDIFLNPTYIGKIAWLRRAEFTKIVNGKIVKGRKRMKEFETFDGLHEPIIDIETWNKVQEINKSNEPKTPINRELKNPMSGVVICAKCGKPMQRRPYAKRGQETSLICNYCDNISSKFCIVEEKLLEALKELLKHYEYTPPKKANKKIDVSVQIQNELNKERKKLERLYVFLENETYSADEFIERSKVVKDRIAELEKELKKLTKPSMSKEEFVPKLKTLVELYDNATVQEKNDLLKSVLEKATYLKTKKLKKNEGNPYDFELTLYPKIR